MLETMCRFCKCDFWPMSSGGASSKRRGNSEIVRRENDVVKANVEFRRSRVADNVSKVFDARIGEVGWRIMCPRYLMRESEMRIEVIFHSYVQLQECISNMGLSKMKILQNWMVHNHFPY